jgi:DNA-binding transcriptional LysR family regulator
MRGLNLDQVHAFADVIELGSFSAAAARQNLSQPAISQQIRQLEDRLGVRLIERVGKRAMPTPAGQALLDRVGQVRIGTGATACIYFLPKVLEQLQRRFPGLEIIVRTGNTSDVLKSIEENSLDIGLVTLPASGRSLDIVPVLTDPFVAIFADGMDVPDLIRPADLADIPLVLYERGGQTRTIVDDWLRAAGVVGHSIMELGSVEAIKVLVGAGLGATILPAMGARLGRTQFPIKTRKLAPDLARSLALVVRRDKVMGSGLREVRNGLIAAARDWTPNQSSSGT